MREKEAEIKIRIRESTVEKLKTVKEKLKLPSYSKTIDFLIEKFSDLKRKKLDIFEKKIDERVESIHKRLGSFEKLYFLRMTKDVFDIKHELYLMSPQKKQSDLQNKEKHSEEIMKYRTKIRKMEDELRLKQEFLDKEHQKASEYLEGLNFLIGKFKFKKSFFGDKYECNLTEEEYRKALRF